MKHQAVHYGKSGLLAFILSAIILLSGSRLYGEDAMSLTLRSAAFTHGGEIPTQYTCQGVDNAPPLAWGGVPENARSLVLIVDDPDAPDPDAPRMTWVHWVLYNIPPATTGLPTGTTASDLSTGMKEGINSWNQTGYGGPCPPVGRHRYFFKLYALDTQLELQGKPTKSEVEAAMRGHVIDQCELLGRYEKK